jgi:hypothetical protein
VRQGNPIFPFPFDLIADVLNIILNNAQNRGYIKRLCIKSAFPGLVNFHFADNIFLFLETNSSYIETKVVMA